MLRYILTSRVIQVGFVLCAVIIVSMQLYSYHVRRTTEDQLHQTIQTLRELKNRYNSRIVEAPRKLTKQEINGVFVDNPNQKIDTHKSVQSTYLQGETITPHKRTEAHNSIGSLREQISDDVIVSPYGFGPYPEVPEEMSADTFPSPSAEHELLARVRIKLLAEGINARGVNMENGRIYPVIPGIVFVIWKEYERPDGNVRYISSMLAHPSDGVRINAIREQKGKDFTEADILQT